MGIAQWKTGNALEKEHNQGLPLLVVKATKGSAGGRTN